MKSNIISSVRLSGTGHKNQKNYFKPGNFLLLCLLASASVIAQNPFKSNADFFPNEKAKVLVVGTFHFDYPNLDAHKTTDDKKIDVLKEPKKSEVTQLVEHIKKFKPTKIILEAMPEWKTGERLQRYKKGEFRDQRDERYQLGMRIATEMNLDTIYGIDAIPFDDELSKQNPTYFEKFFDGFDFKSDDPYATQIMQWYNHEESLTSQMNLLQYFKRMNSRESHQLTYGAYLVGDFKLDDTRGADILSIWWYNRNLRIFRKVQQIAKPQDRILMIYGNGHAAILRQLFECSPEYEFVEFDSLK